MPICSLVAHETNAHRSDDADVCALHEEAQAFASAFRHSGWANVRAKVADGIRRVAGYGPRLARFNRCGQNAWIIRKVDDPDTLALAGDACRDRFCIPCAQWRATRIANSLRRHCEDRPLLFVTLTLADAWQHEDGRVESVRPRKADAAGWTRIPLRELLAKLYKSFSALRRCDFWKNEVKGGAAFLELKWKPKKGRWHPHLHLMLEARYLPQDELRAAWLRITKTSHRIDVQRVRDRENAINECCKYASKPVAHTYADVPELLDEAIDALKGKRFCNCFGEWRGLKLTESVEDAGWERVAPLGAMLVKASYGAADAIAMLERLGVNIPEQRPPPTVDPLEFFAPANGLSAELVEELRQEALSRFAA